MSKASDAANSVVYAVTQVCDLFGVQYTREQSRMFNVQGAAGRWRPMFFGEWIDQHGKKHHGGKADILARPRIVYAPDPDSPRMRFAVPLWIECKSGKGKPSHDQNAFRQWVTSNGDYFLLIHDDVRPLIAWFKEHGVEKRPADEALNAITTPLSADALHDLPCRWCKMRRAEHMGKIAACSGMVGKVWSPDLKAAPKPL